MKKLSIKTKIALYFTAFMVLLSLFIFGVISLISSQSQSSNEKNTLQRVVLENAKEVEYDDGELEYDDDFHAYTSGVYTLVYDENQTKLKGNAPYDELSELTFSEGQIREVSVSGTAYLVYDFHHSDTDGPSLLLRGIIEKNSGAIRIDTILTASLIAFPIMILVAAVIGYFISGRLLGPIRKISDTAESIGRTGNLKERIPLGQSQDELYRLSDTFNNMFERLDKNFMSERQFTSDASHELRTPVTVILSQCEYAFEHAKSKDELYEALGVIQGQGYRMKRLIEALLRFTRLDQQSDQIHLELRDISSLTEAICHESPDIYDKGIQLHTEIEKGIEKTVDQELYTLMLGNLISNAYKYGKQGGNITVRLYRIDHADKGGKVGLSVTDDGIGIALMDLPNICNRFYRADKSRNEGGSRSFGLGLSMVKEIATLHGGVLNIKSREGFGSEFTVEL